MDESRIESDNREIQKEEIFARNRRKTVEINQWVLKALQGDLDDLKDIEKLKQN